MVDCYKENSNGKTLPVGQKPANGFGLYDLNGSVGKEMGSGNAGNGVKEMGSGRVKEMGSGLYL